MNRAINTASFATINQVERHGKTSDKYALIPTSRVLSVFADHGWMPSRIQEANTRVEENKGFQKHMVRLRQEGANALRVGDELAEIVLVNSHMGSASFHAMLGIFRLICMNGAVVGSTFDSHRVRHMGYTDAAIEQAIGALVTAAPKALEQVERFRAIELSREEQTAFAEAAIEAVNDGEKFVVEPRSMLSVRRSDDRRSDLWTTFNVVQENVIRGGVRRITSDGRRQRSRAVKSIDQSVKLNQALWTLTEKMAELKTAV